ncbi:SCO6745 family protein [Amycolatopsis cihanbeyliensis]|uniref:SalK n=1 Tax=Amycolatopsis cihanbeyliensis TaxID=1128664 RepID=A0A542DPG5_AMYCI|nr:hypothetical protein [Amycolatopsis cihanbeyliensis]TQJ04946.1 hypothetical protein FB471_4758 [Amycolatopsis cihanbeyliensis]
MDHQEAAQLAYRCHRVLEPLHSMVYFAPEAEDRLTAAGLRPGRMCYFASRSAPMGAVGPGTVAATFFNFNPVLVAEHIPEAWKLATPEQVLEARLVAADAALRRLLGADADSEQVAEAADLARQAAELCIPEGRPLYAAHADLDWPSEPHLVLWHAASLLREFRGDGHIAALVGAGLNGLTALVTHTATGKGFLESVAKRLRGWSDDQWAATVDYLRGEGLLDADGNLTEQGNQLRERVEADTNAAAAGPFATLGAEKAERLRELGRSLSRQIIAEGAYPQEGIFANSR